MVFRKKRGMIDVRELQRRGIVRPPKEEDVVVPTNKEGFVDLVGSSGSKPSYPTFFKNQEKSAAKTSSTNFSTEKEGYNKQEVDTKIIDLDNKIYKLEQRIELLERKAGVNQSSSYQENNLIGW